jgi:DNA-binding PadR family transcriptional regulator
VTGEVGGTASHEHRAARPHDDTHHVVAGFALLLLERGARTTEDLSERLTQLQVVRGRLDHESLAGLIDEFERTGLIVRRDASSVTSKAYELTPAGRVIVNDWVAIMRDRRRLSRTFLALYDRTDE